MKLLADVRVHNTGMWLISGVHILEIFFFLFLCFMGFVQMKLYPAVPVSPLEHISNWSLMRAELCAQHRLQFTFTEPAR